MNKPFAPACERNQAPILAVLETHLPSRCSILEIGSGTGQHAVHFASHQPEWLWQCSDQAEYLPGIGQWIAEANRSNLPNAIELTAQENAVGIWPNCDALFSANTLHIMAWQEVEQFFRLAGESVHQEGKLLVYGPFNYQGRYSSESNAQFDVWLKQQASHRAIRDFEAVDQLASAAGFRLLQDHEMPANNRCLVWNKIGN